MAPRPRLLRQVPLIEKQPERMLRPVAKVLVALARMVVVALPVETEKTELDALVNVVSPVKAFAPLKVLELARSVVEATEMEDPAVKATPLTVPSEPVR